MIITILFILMVNVLAGMTEEFDNLEFPPRPLEPSPGECCGCGCERCVYTYYEEAIMRWEIKVARLREEYNSRNKNGKV